MQMSIAIYVACYISSTKIIYMCVCVSYIAMRHYYACRHAIPVSLYIYGYKYRYSYIILLYFRQLHNLGLCNNGKSDILISLIIFTDLSR